MKDIKSIEEISQLGQDNKLYALVDGQFVLADEKLVAKNNCYVGDYDFDMNCLLDWLQTHNIEDYFYLSDSAGDIVRCNGRGFTTGTDSGKILFWAYVYYGSNKMSAWAYVAEDNQEKQSTFTDITGYGGSSEWGTLDIYSTSKKYWGMGHQWLNASYKTTITDSSGIVHSLNTVPSSNIRKMILELVMVQGKTLAEIQAMASNVNRVLSGLNNLLVFESTTAQSIPNNSDTAFVTTEVLPKGTYLIFASIQFATNGTGRRALKYVPSANYVTDALFKQAESGGSTCIQFNRLVRYDTDDIHKYYAYQSSGSALNLLSYSVRMIRLGD